MKQNDEKILYHVQHATKLAPPKPELKARGKRLLGKKKQAATLSNEMDTDMMKNEDEKLLKNYFRLDFSLDEMYAKWSDSDPNFKEVASKFHGVRMLNQDPVENIFSFICSSNNNIARYGLGRNHLLYYISLVTSSIMGFIKKTNYNCYLKDIHHG